MSRSTTSTIQGLESRRLLAAFLFGDTLIVTGTEGADAIDINYASLTLGTPINVTINGHKQPFPTSRVARILVNSRGGNDRIGLGLLGFDDPRIGAPAPVVPVGVNVPAVVWGGAGDDWIVGGLANDFILGGAGNDSVNGNRGDDHVSGNDGNDTVGGASGNDVLFGGAGNDVVSDMFGNDTLFGDAGDDQLTDHVGENLLVGGAGNDTFGPDNPFDLAYFGPPKNRIFGGPGNDVLRRFADAPNNDQVSGVETIQIVQQQ